MSEEENKLSTLLSVCEYSGFCFMEVFGLVTVDVIYNTQ